MYCCANMLKYRFCRCSRIVKNNFDLVVLPFTQVNYAVSILKLRYIGFVLLIMIVTVFLHNLHRWTSARLSQIECHINTFDAILRKTTFSFIKRCQSSSNNLINSLTTSGCFYESNFMSITTTCCLLFCNFQLPFDHSCWPLFMLILLVFLYLLFPKDFASCCLCLPLVSEMHK